MSKKPSVILAVSLASSIFVASAANCSASSKSLTPLATNNKPMTVTVFSSYANNQGIMQGWAGKYIKDKFNITLNVIAPNVAGGGDTLYDTRSAAGDLGDLVYVGTDKLKNTIKAGLLLNMNSNSLLKNYGKNISKYPAAIKKFQTAYNTGSAVYAIPGAVSSQSPTTPSEYGDLTFGAFSRWDYYTALGKPKLNTLNDLIPMLKKMQAKYPKGADGKKTYGFSLFKDWDGGGMCLAQQMGALYGYSEQDYVEYNSDATKVRSILDPSSYYMKSLKLYYDANQAGLLDPDSATQNWDTVTTKFTNGDVLFSWWNFLGKSQYNTTAKQAAGKGFMMLPLKDETILSEGCRPAGNTYSVGIGSKAADPVRLMQFLDWTYSPAGVEFANNGPQGLTWTKQKNGKNAVTSFGMKALPTNDVQVPSSFGGGSYKQGGLTINFPTVNLNDIDPTTKEPYNYLSWLAYRKVTRTPLLTSWTKGMGGATTAIDYLKKNKQIAVKVSTDYVNLTVPDDLKTIQNQVKLIVVQDSWKMIFAKNKAEYTSLYNNMISTAKGLGIDKVVAFDKKDIAGVAKSIAETKASAK